MKIQNLIILIKLKSFNNQEKFKNIYFIRFLNLEIIKL